MHSLTIFPQHTIGRISRPYLEVEPLTLRPGVETPRLTSGTLLVLDVKSLDADWSNLTELVSTVQVRFPAAPVILRMSEVTTSSVRLAQRAARLRVRAVVGVGEPLYETLRPILTQPDDLGEDVVNWLSLRGKRLSPAAASLLGHIIGRGAAFPQLGELLDTVRESERTARHRFSRESLAPPSTWHQAARALRSALKIQANPETPLLQLALELGYSDHSGFSRQLTRTFGVTPGAIQGTLGWEWLLNRWLSRPSARHLHAA